MAAYVLNINGVERPLHLGSLSLQTVVNGRHVMSCSVISEAGAYRPLVAEEAELLEDGTPMFGGVIRLVEEEGAGGQPIAHISSRITCDSFNVFAERRFVTLTIPAGVTLKAALELLDDYLTSYGVVLDPAQVTGPILDAEQTAYGQALNGVLDTLSQRTGFIWEIDATKTFRMFEPGTIACPINIIDGDEHHVGDIKVERSRDKYVNRVIVKGGKPGLFDLVDAFVADGIEDTFTLRQPIAGPLAPLPAQDGAVGYAVVDVGPTGYESLGGLLAADVFWEYDPVGRTVHRRDGPPAAGPFQVRYQAQYPIFVTAEDAAEIALHGIWEAVYEYPDIYDQAVLEELAASLLSQGLEIKTELTIQTRELGVAAGQSLTVTAAYRDIDAEFLITEVNAATEATGDSLRRTIKCVEGSVFKGSFRGLIKAWLGGGSVAAASAGPPAGATGGVPHPPDKAVQFNRAAAFGGDPAFTYYETEHSVVCGDLSSIDAAAFESCQVFGYDNHIADP